MLRFRLILCQLTLLIFFFASHSLGSAPASKVARYKIRFGDTLAKIAHKHRTSVSYLKRLNGLGRSNYIKAGTRIKVPRRAKHIKRARSHKRPRIYRVRSGDTLANIASRFRVRTVALARWNGMRLSSTLKVGRRLRLAPPARRSKRRHKPRHTEKNTWVTGIGQAKMLLPSGFKKPTIRSKKFHHKDYTLTLYAHRFAVGNAVYIEVIANKGKTLSRPMLKLNNKKVPLTSRPWGYRGILAFSAYGKAGKVNLSVSTFSSQSTYKLYVAKTKYPLSVWRRYLGNYDRKRRPLTAKQKQLRAKRAKERRRLIKASTKKKSHIFSLFTLDRLNNRTAHPRGYHRVTSKFFTNRKIVKWYKKNRKRHYHKPRYIRHRGLDLAGRTGAPIYALASGKVVCSQRMYYEGNFTVIDHGNGIFSGYMHQSKMIAKEGQTLNAGDLLGKVGTTGKVTGPHLHVSLWVRGKPVQPLSLVGLPIR